LGDSGNVLFVSWKNNDDFEMVFEQDDGTIFELHGFMETLKKLKELSDPRGALTVLERVKFDPIII
jgi:hypothetical protein